MKWSGKLQRDFPLQKIRAQVYDLNQSGTAEATAFRLLWKHEQAEGFLYARAAWDGRFVYITKSQTMESAWKLNGGTEK